MAVNRFIKLKVFIMQWVCGLIPFKHINGAFVRLPFEVSRAFWPFRRHQVEPYELSAIETYGERNGVYIDIGANVGLLTIAMRRHAGSEATIYAVEPNPATAAMLEKVLERNRVAPRAVWEVAISDRNGTAHFRLSKRDWLGVMSSFANTDPDAIDAHVLVMTLDSLAGDLPRLDYVKIDVEGAELLVLRGAARVLRKLRPVVQIEIHGPFLPHFGYTVNDIFQLMSGHSYRPINAVTGKETTAEEFEADSGLDALHPITRRTMRHSGYGHIVFLPAERRFEN